MKILELRFKNLNSLYGDWVIDFSAPEYVANGIFALTGPTGAGKSTILDAICLALYGVTPRLRKINKNDNEIMSRQTGECFAEVLFASQAGRFRCHWEQRRARKNAAGHLQDPEHWIVDADSGLTIENKKSLVTGIIEEKTGMDFDRFTRSILLAQGGFDTFLKADAEQKSRILEQITGTGIYTEISRLVHERQRQEQEKLSLLQAEISGIVLLTPEEELELQGTLVLQQRQEAELAGQAADTGKAIAWLQTMDALKKEIHGMAAEEIKLQEAVAEFKPKYDKLDWAKKAASLDGTYATLTLTRRQQADDLVSQQKLGKAFPELEKQANLQMELLQGAEQGTQAAKEALKDAAPLMQKIRLLDQQLIAKEKALSEAARTCRQETVKIEERRLAYREVKATQSTSEKALEELDVYFKEHVQDEWLISGLGGIEEQFGNLLSRGREIIQKETGLKNVEMACVQAQKQVAASAKHSHLCLQELAAASQQLQQAQVALGELLGDRLLREYREEKDALQREMLLLRTIEKLEDQRSRLESGKACPLCGATEHPYAKGNVPKPDAMEQKIASLTQRICKAEDFETAIEKLKKAEGIVEKKITVSEKQEAQVANELKAAEKTLAEKKEGLGQLRNDSAVLKQVVLLKLQPLGITEIPEAKAASLLASLKKRLQTWQDQVKRKAALEKQMAELDSKMKSLAAVIEAQSAALAQQQEHLEQLKTEVAVERNERMALYAEKKPDVEEMRMNQVLSVAEDAEKQTRNRYNELLQKLTSEKTQIETLKKRIEGRTPELKNSEVFFAAALAPLGFTDETHFLSVRLPTAQQEFLSVRAKELDDKQTELKARQRDRELRLAEECSKNLTEQSFAELEIRFQQFTDALQGLRDELAGRKHQLKENAAAKERVKEKQTGIEAQKKECWRWGKLHELIGSADGKKYRNFAQGLTFEVMVSHANLQLSKMSDRYLLRRDDEEPLELNVIDNYQAGETRSTRNLSGGESFLVSLALALGLSKMASQKVRVDSLFLDEGFGTLDEDALETALNTLAGLHQDGKLIGIISHVSALKEKISTQINISPLSGGRSALTGPGCRKNRVEQNHPEV